MATLKQDLVSLGFHEHLPEVMERRLYRGYTFQLVEGEDRPWGRWTRGVGLYLLSPRCEAFMKWLFAKPRNRFVRYRPRTFIDNPYGVIAEVLAGLQRRGRNRYLYSAAIELPFRRFRELVEKMSSPAGLFDVLYADGFTNFVWIEEGAWKFLFLAAERGLSVEEIRAWLADPRLKQTIVSWRMVRPLDKAIVEAFLEEYAAFRKQARRPSPA